MLTVGQEVDRYIVEDVIGEGGIAHVFRVRHRTLKTLHALKVLKVGGRALCERLVQEGQLQASIRHTNIVAVTDVVEVDGSPGLLMEYVHGGALDRWLDEHRPDVEQSERIFRGIVAGVARAHKHGLVHRDLKPGNVLVEVGDDGVVPKVADFGLAKILLDEGGGAKTTRSGVGMGTPAYMSPEQLRNAKGVDQRTDIWALGCILYELLSQRSPFEHDDVLQVFAALADGRYVPIEEAAPGVPKHLAAAIRASLCSDRERRPADCAALLAILDGGVHAPRPAPLVAAAASGFDPSGDPTHSLQGSVGSGATGGRRRGHTTPLSALQSATPAQTFMIGEAFGPDPADSFVALKGAGGPKESFAGRSSPGSRTSATSEFESSAPRAVPPWAALVGVGAVAVGGLGLIALVTIGVLWQRSDGSDAPTGDAPALLEADAPGSPAVAAVGTPGATAPAAPEPAASAAAHGATTAGSTRVSGAPSSGAASSGASAARIVATESPPAAAGPPAAAAPSAAAPVLDPAVAQPEAAPIEAVPTGSVTVTGDAKSVVLIGQDGSSHRPGNNLPVGAYAVRVTFAGGVTINGSMSVAENGSYAMKCVSEMQRCGGGGWKASE